MSSMDASSTKTEMKRKQAFPDVAASLSASGFAARRLAEITLICSRSVPFHEIKTLSTRNLSSGGGKTSCRHLRRRATSHNRRYKKRYLGALAPTDISIGMSRRSRRNNKYLLKQPHEVWKSQNEDVEGFQVVQWVPTHLWHVKRFRMETLWGWKVPMMHSNRGTRAALRMSLDGCTLMMDVSWKYQPVWVSFENHDASAILATVKRIIPAFVLSAVSTSMSGSAVFHDTDQFPCHLHGPVEWYTTSSNPFGENISSENITYLYFFTHPTLQTILFGLLLVILEGIASIQGPFKGVDGGLGCLKLCGLSVTDTIYKCISDRSDIRSHLLISTTHPVVEHDMTRLKKFASSVDSKLVTIMASCTRDRITMCNAVAYSIHVFAEPCVIQSLFQDLALHEKVRVVGLAEEMAVLLECQPPMPYWPRDFIDSEQGRLFWSADSDEWSIVRAYDDTDVGSQRPNSRCYKPTMFDLEDPIIIRGEHGIPLVELLARSARVVPLGKSENRKRRHSSGSSSILHVAPFLSRIESEAFQLDCNKLRLMMTLPGALLCHLLVPRGRIRSGCRLFADSRDIGFATSGSFSFSRGYCHGLALLVASEFLLALGERRTPIMVLRSSDGSSQFLVGLHAQCGDTTVSCYAYILL